MSATADRGHAGCARRSAAPGGDAPALVYCLWFGDRSVGRRRRRRLRGPGLRPASSSPSSGRSSPRVPRPPGKVGLCRAAIGAGDGDRRADRVIDSVLDDGLQALSAADLAAARRKVRRRGAPPSAPRSAPACRRDRLRHRRIFAFDDEPGRVMGADGAATPGSTPTIGSTIPLDTFRDQREAPSTSPPIRPARWWTAWSRTAS